MIDLDIVQHYEKLVIKPALLILSLLFYFLQIALKLFVNVIVHQCHAHRMSVALRSAIRVAYL